jgi:pimeloyl-ACP methyl ester carboxylesterase
MTWVLIALAAVVLYFPFTLLLTAAVWRNRRVAPIRTPDALGVPFEDVRFPTANGKTLHGWWVPANSTRRPAVILVHGWGRNAERMLPYIAILHPLGYHLLAFDARNHGGSDRDGPASMKLFSEDVRAAVNELTTRSGVDVGRIAVLGLSIGGSAAIHAAAHDPRIRAVVAVGAFAHPRDAMLEMGFGTFWLAPARPLLFRFMEWSVGARLDDLAPERQIVAASTRFLLVHGENDAVVSVRHAHRLARAAPDRTELWVVPGRGHSDVHREPALPSRVEEFLRAALACDAPPSRTADRARRSAADYEQP